MKVIWNPETRLITFNLGDSVLNEMGSIGNDPAYVLGEWENEDLDRLDKALFDAISNPDAYRKCGVGHTTKFEITPELARYIVHSEIYYWGDPCGFDPDTWPAKKKMRELARKLTDICDEVDGTADKYPWYKPHKPLTMY